MKHRALQPYLNDLKTTLTNEGSEYEVWGDTLRLEARAQHDSEAVLNEPQVKAIAEKGYELLKVRVFMGQGPNYTDHVFPLSTQSRTQVQQTSGLGSLGSLGSLGGFGGLAGIGGDSMQALSAELDFRETRKDNERLKKENEELKKKYKTAKRQVKDLDEKLQSLPMYKMGGMALSGTLSGLLQSPQFASSPLAGLLAPGDLGAGQHALHEPEPSGDMRATYTLHEDPQELNGTTYSPQLLNAAKALDELFASPEEKSMVFDIIQGLAMRKDLMPSILAHLNKHTQQA